MQRKLIQLSPSTSVVSLPSSWVKMNKLKKGESLNVEVQDNDIIISTRNKKSRKEIHLDISNLHGELMWVAIDAAYTMGYDSIILKTRNQEQAVYMTKVVRYFPGMMIVDERNNMVHFKAIAEQKEDDIGKILNRIFNLNIAMIEDAREFIKTKNYKALADMKRRDYVINSYVSYCCRFISKFGFIPFSKIGVMHTYIKSIEILSDAIVSLFVEIGTQKINMANKSRPIELLNEIYLHIQKMHTKFSQERLIFFEDKRLSLKKHIKKMPAILQQHLNTALEILFDIGELELQLNV